MRAVLIDTDFSEPQRAGIHAFDFWANHQAEIEALAGDSPPAQLSDELAQKVMLVYGGTPITNKAAEGVIKAQKNIMKTCGMGMDPSMFQARLSVGESEGYIQVSKELMACFRAQVRAGDVRKQEERRAAKVQAQAAAARGPKVNAEFIQAKRKALEQAGPQAAARPRMI